jgi:hypothetical protein
MAQETPIIRSVHLRPWRHGTDISVRPIYPQDIHLRDERVYAAAANGFWGAREGKSLRNRAGDDGTPEFRGESG